MKILSAFLLIRWFVIVEVAVDLKIHVQAVGGFLVAWTYCNSRMFRNKAWCFLLGVSVLWLVQVTTQHQMVRHRICPCVVVHHKEYEAHGTESGAKRLTGVSSMSVTSFLSL